MGGDLNNLSSLLTESRQAQENREGQQFQQKPGGTAKTVVSRKGLPNTADIVPPANEPKASTSVGKANDIWSVDEVPSEESLMAVNDGRPAPRYEMSYKQSIGTEDSFLGLGDKTPLTQDCSHLVVKIHFPGSTLKEVDVDVKKNRIKATSKTHRLFTYLPVDVDDANGKAAFDSAKEVLTITLPIIHEFGF